ncbi:MAG: GNAT family N-acetyltransferase [Caulobacteraceae bacterium]
MDVETVRREAETPVVGLRADFDEIVQTLTDAFAADPHFDWFMRAGAGREAARCGFFRMLIGRRRPDQGPHRPPRRRRRGGGVDAVRLAAPDPADAELRGLPSILRMTGLARLGRLMAIRADLDRHHPMDRPHAYLWFLGVAPAAQGRGVGSALLRAANARHDTAGLPAYLETGTARNVALYERHGFQGDLRAQGAGGRAEHVEHVAGGGGVRQHLILAGSPAALARRQGKAARSSPRRRAAFPRPRRRRAFGAGAEGRVAPGVADRFHQLPD